MQKYTQPYENDDISCHLQQIGMGALVCRAAVQKGDGGIAVLLVLCLS